MEKNIEIEKIRHSLAHLLASAVLQIYPNAKNTIGPAVENGFYYDFDFKCGTNAEKTQNERGNDLPSESDLKKIENKMREIVKHWEVFKEIEVSAEEAKKVFAENSYKLELIEELEKAGEKITLYYSGPKNSIPSLPILQTANYKLQTGFLDLCRGGHAENPSQDIASGSWKLSRIAGAYWRGDEKNRMLTRIYGLAFNSKKELEDYETQIEEAKKRDHKKLGKELDLFTFSDLVGTGLPLWTPKGTLVRNLLDDFVWQLRKKYGYEKVEIPHITKKDLYEKSGHWDKFQDELFKINTREKHIFAMKPMNCPHHTQIYSRKMWSYRELPQRYANTTTCYRDEQTGELSGLSRVRSFAQDDAHVFCRQGQVKEEFLKVWEIIHEFYGAFGFKLKLRLSLHDPKKPEKYLGNPESWIKAENTLREIAVEKKADFYEGIGEAAFYGPKLDFMAKDSLRREWQVATIQLDMNMPERFDLTCTNEEGKPERIVMIHAAIMGSIERFLSILIEHYAGAFPLWLSPIQIAIIPVSEKFNDYSKKIAQKLREQNIRVEMNDSNESLGKKVRATKMQKAPYFAVIGEKETSTNQITLEGKNGTQICTVEELLKKLIEEINTKT
jgi:threonyl-tRNA synthetase